MPILAGKEPFVPITHLSLESTLYDTRGKEGDGDLTPQQEAGRLLPPPPAVFKQSSTWRGKRQVSTILTKKYDVP